MNTQQAKLYQRIQAFCLDEPDVNLPLSKRLARDNGWTREYTQRVIDEYKKFVFLAVSAGQGIFLLWLCRYINGEVSDTFCHPNT